MNKPLLAAQNIVFGYSHQNMFDDLTLHINQDDRIGLVGTNGCGKSTLLKALSGKLPISGGQIVTNNRMILSIVDQFVPEHLLKLSIYDIVLEPIAESLRDEQAYLADILLADLGFDPADFNKRIDELSGGQVNLILLARAIINEPDLLFMDEPSNHLDVEALVKLEQFFKVHFQKPFLIISHDAALLDHITNKTIFLKDGKAYSYDLPFTKAREAFLAFEADLKKQHQDETKEIDRLAQSAKRLAIWGREHDNEKFSRKAKSIEKKVDKLEANKTETFKRNKYYLSIKSEPIRAKCLLEVKDFEVQNIADQSKLYGVEKFYINNGDRIILFGKNGAGKSTFIKKLVEHFGAENHAHIRFNPQVNLGYYDQEQEELDHNANIFDYLNDQFKLPDLEIKRTLQKAGFGYDEHDKKIASLSGGEKARILFAKLSLQKPNFIILDEPTNHIDLYGRQELIDQLLKLNITLLIIGHDRHFCDVVGTRFFMIDGKKLIEINESEEFYQTLKLDDEASFEANKTSQGSSQENQVAEKEEIEADEDGDILDQILQLEQLLEDDLARKAKHQKPQLQEKWREEIATLYAKLEQ